MGVSVTCAKRGVAAIAAPNDMAQRADLRI